MRKSSIANDRVKPKSNFGIFLDDKFVNLISPIIEIFYANTSTDL